MARREGEGEGEGEGDGGEDIVVVVVVVVGVDLVWEELGDWVLGAKANGFCGVAVVESLMAFFYVKRERR